MQGSDLRAIRKALGLTIKEMADGLGISDRHLGDMERDKAAIERRTELAARFLAEHPEQASES